MKKLSFLLSILLIGITAVAQEFSINTSKSEIKWNGKKVTGEHWGYVQFKEGSFKLEDNKIVSGSFKVDMASITDEDLEDQNWNAKLVGHLKSDDFFGVDKFPEAILKITGASEFKNGVTSVQANLTIKGISEPVNFEVKKSNSTYTASITVDRTKYNVRYGSGKFFDGLGDNMIYDDFTLDVKIITE